MSSLADNLPKPAPLAAGTLRITPLGGLGEVGRNLSVLEYRGRLLILDCGVLFPEEHQPGVDLILPDLSYLDGRLQDIEAIVLTHGHEDHIGAVPYLLRRREDIPLIGSQLTLAFVTAKLREHKVTPRTREVHAGERVKEGDFDLEFIQVNHSIPDALAVGIRTPAGTVLATGDFKMDQLPLDGRITDLRAFARLGEEGVDLFMVDSTNAEVPGFTVGEREIGPVLDSVFANARGRVVVASFSSHVHRVQQVLNAAAAHGRKVALVGRSMIRNMTIASELGYLHVPERVLVDLKAVKDLPDEQVVLMCTGSQGEPMAALSRIAAGDHQVEVGPGDTVVLASSLIPGNENAVSRVINDLTRLGARVIHQGNARVHVSGHASAGELLYCYNIVRPRNVMPIHGEMRHLVANGNLAVQTGVEPERVLLTENGVVVDLKDGRAQIAGAVPLQSIYVDGSAIGTITDSQLQDRRTMSEEGFIAIYATIDGRTKQIVTPVELRARGFAEDDSRLGEVAPNVRKALEEALAEGTTSPRELQQVIRRVVGRWAGNRLRRRPMIMPVVSLLK